MSVCKRCLDKALPPYKRAMYRSKCVEANIIQNFEKLLKESVLFIFAI